LQVEIPAGNNRVFCIFRLRGYYAGLYAGFHEFPKLIVATVGTPLNIRPVFGFWGTAYVYIFAAVAIDEIVKTVRRPNYYLPFSDGLPVFRYRLSNDIRRQNSRRSSNRSQSSRVICWISAKFSFTQTFTSLIQFVKPHFITFEIEKKTGDQRKNHDKGSVYFIWFIKQVTHNYSK
jgi:hypothetical protein